MRKHIEKYIEIEGEEYLVKITADFSEEAGSVDSEFWGSPCTENIVSLEHSGFWDFEILEPADADIGKIEKHIDENIDDIIYEIKES
jgi:hypothetical protein